MQPTHPLKFVLALAFAATPLFSLHAGTGDDGISAPDKATPSLETSSESIYDKIWDVPKLYRDDNNPVVEEIDAIGRFQLDNFNVDSDRGHNNFWEIRRFRLGADAFFAERHLEVKAEVDTALHTYDTPSTFYNRMTNLWAKVYVNDAFNVRFGKFEPHFGYDREFTDALQKFFERSFFDDQVIGSNDYISGVEVSGKFGHFSYMGSIYSTNVDKEFGQFDGGQAYEAEINYDFSKALNAGKALWTLDYLHADGKNEHTNVFTNYRDAAATYFDLEKGRFCMVAQVAYGHQVDDKGDVGELLLMPSFKVTEKLELITRYTLGIASEDNGISTLNRQQHTIGTFTGDNYNSLYLGADYYLYGQKLKLMFGEEYASLRGGTGTAANYNGWTTWVGFRLFF